MKRPYREQQKRITKKERAFVDQLYGAGAVNRQKTLEDFVDPAPSERGPGFYGELEQQMNERGDHNSFPNGPKGK